MSGLGTLERPAQIIDNEYAGAHFTTTFSDAYRMPPSIDARPRPGHLAYDYLTLAMVLLGIVENAMIWLRVDVRWLLPTLGLVLALALPTRLLSKALKGKVHGLGLRLPLALSLTVLALMTGGLVLNTVLPWFGDPRPLASVPILCFVDGLNLAIIAARPQVLNRDDFRRARLKSSDKAAIAFTVLGLLMAVLGAVRLNNNAGGGLAELALTVTIVVAILLMVRPQAVRHDVLLFCLYGIALTVLYMTSLRGWYTTGHDIQTEFRVFSLVHASERWFIGSAGTTYNACLSITILPQMFWALTRVATPYVFKVDFPLMFAACPLALYELSRRILGKRMAVASALLFICFPTFVNDIVFLNRQEVAFLFVSVMLALIFCGGANLRRRRVLIALCLVGMILAHYSTSYVFIGTMLVAVVGLSASKVIARMVSGRSRPGHHGGGGKTTAWARSSTVRLDKRPVVFNWTLLLVAFVLATAWSFVDVQASPSFGPYVHQVLNAFTGDIELFGGTNQGVNYSLTSSGSTVTPSSELAAWRLELTHLIGPHRVEEGYYPLSVVDKYPTPPAPALSLPPTAVGRALSRVHVDPNELNSLLRNLIARSLQVFALVGIAGVFLNWRRRSRVTAEHVFIAIGSLILLVASVVLPALSVDYSLGRMFQEALFVLAPLIIVGTLFVLRPLGARRSEILVCALTGLFFVSLSGLMPQVTGGYPPDLNLNNSGSYYENYYTDQQEVSAVNWLNALVKKGAVVQADPFAAIRFDPYMSILIDPDDFPTAVLRNSYVVLGTDTVQTGVSTAPPTGALVDFEYPVAFLGKEKDLIYASDGAEIFH